jgi:hypothetical protein
MIWRETCRDPTDMEVDVMQGESYVEAAEALGLTPRS